MSPTTIQHHRVLLMCLLIAGLIFVLDRAGGLLSRLELAALDWRFVARGPRPPGPDVVLVTIDDKSLGELGEWPWPRSYHAALVDVLRARGAAVVAFDIAFSEGPSPAEDKAFASAIRRAGSVVLAAGYIPQRTMGQSGSAGQQAVELTPDRLLSSDTMRRSSPPAPGSRPRWLGAPTREFFWTLPAAKLLDAARGAGLVNLPADPDAIFRRAALLKPVDNGCLYPHLALLAAAVKLGVPPRDIRVDPAGGIRLGRRRAIPVAEDGTLLIDFVGPPPSARQPSLFPRYSYCDVLAVSPLFHRSGRRGSAAPIHAGAFRGKVVFVGATAPALMDRKPSPYSPHAVGVEANANLANAILQRRFFAQPGPATAALLMLGVGLVVGGLLSWQSMARGTVSVFALVLAYLLAALWLFAAYRIILPIAASLFTALFCYAWTMAYWFQTEYRERVRIRLFLDRYVTPEVAERVLRDRLGALSGRRADVSVLFAEIPGFAAHARAMDPQEVVEVLNGYFACLTPAVLEQEGTLMQYCGDEIMGVWGAPIEQPDHARRAVLAALGMRERLRDLQPVWRAHRLPPLALAIGINSGRAVAGSVGSSKRPQYSVVGDTVNTASRLKSQSSELGVATIVSESTYRHVAQLVEMRPLPPLTVKGKAEPLIVFEVLGAKDTLPAPAAPVAAEPVAATADRSRE